MVRRVLKFAPSPTGNRYPSPFDGQPPRYTGPDMIGKPATPRRSLASILTHHGEMPAARGGDWIGKRIQRIHIDVFPPSDKIGA